jgi:hypothetical protein
MPPTSGAAWQAIDKRWLVVAFIGSFSLYLFPLLTVHVTMPWGIVLWQEVFYFASERGAAWTVLDLCFAAVLQLCVGALFYWAFSRWRWWHVPVLLAAAPAFLVVVNVGYLYAIPTVILIERDPAREHGDWPLACEVPNAEVAQVAYDPIAALESAAEAWIVVAGERYGLLNASGCEVRELPLSIHRTSIRQVIPGGGALFGVHERDAAGERLFLLPPGGEPLPLNEADAVPYRSPVLASDASALAWIHREPGEGGQGPTWSIRLRTISTADEREIKLRLTRPASIELIAFDHRQPRFLARRNGKEIVSIDHEGRITTETQAPDPAAHPTQRVQQAASGWVAWEIYRERGRHRLAWSLPAGAGLHELPRGRGIDHVSVSPDGALIAVGAGPTLNIGSVRDTVYVLRAADGVEVFRRFFNPYTRSRPTFLGSRLFALTVVEDGAARIEVLEIPKDPR